MPPASRVSTRSVNRARRSAIQPRAGSTASFPWLEMLGKEHSSFSSSMKRREFFSMYASTALVEITVPLFHPRNLVVWRTKTPRTQSLRREFAGTPYDDRRVPLFAATESRCGDQLAPMVRRRFRGSEAHHAPDP